MHSVIYIFMFTSMLLAGCFCVLLLQRMNVFSLTHALATGDFCLHAMLNLYLLKILYTFTTLSLNISLTFD